MISKLAGIFSAKNTKTKSWWMKLGAAIILSNVFFFLLFGGNNTSVADDTSVTPQGWVEIQLEARLHTPFQIGKKVYLYSRSARTKITGVLKQSGNELDERITVLVKDDEAALLFQDNHWEIMPIIQNLRFKTIVKRENHEIHF